MSFISILDDIGHGLKVFFTDATKVAVAAEPFVDTVFPGIAPLYNLTVKAVSDAEANAIAAGSQTGTGETKLALVIASIQNDFSAYANSAGLHIPDQSAITNWVNGVVATLNAIPSALSTAAAPVVAQAIPGTAANPMVK